MLFSSFPQKVHRRETEDDFIKEICSNEPVVVIFGPMHVGKSHLAEHYFSKYLNLKYADLSDSETRSEALRDIDSFLNTYQIIDELEPASSILHAIYRRIENNRNPCQYILIICDYFTSLRANTYEDINFAALQAKIMYIYPLSLSERSLLSGTDCMGALLSADVHCGFPEAYLQQLGSTYCYTYIEEIYRQFKKCTLYPEPMSEFIDLYKCIAESTGQFYDGEKDNEVSDLMFFLEKKFLLKYVYIFDSNSLNRKNYFTDMGLLCYLLKTERSEDIIPFESIKGNVFKNLVFMELETALRRNWFADQIYVYYFDEYVKIDFIFEYNNCIYLFDVKLSAKKSSIKPFRIFNNQYANKYRRENIKQYVVYYHGIGRSNQNNKQSDINFVNINDLRSTIDGIFLKL